MPSENDLRDLFARADAPNRLDAELVIRRSRARRLPRQLAAGSLGALALAGITVLGVQVSQFPSPASMTAGQAYDSSAPAPEADNLIKRAPADKVNLCAGPLAEVAPSQYGLQLDVTLPRSAATGTVAVPATVRLTNTSDRRVVGYTPTAPAITLSRAGVVLWHSNGPTALALLPLDLAPGASVEYEASFTPVRCEVDDDLAPSFRTDLSALGPGDYQLSALIDFTADPSMGQESPELDLVSGPLSTVTIG